MILKAQMQTVGDKTLICGLRSYDRYGLLITVGGVGCIGGDFSQTVDGSATIVRLCWAIKWLLTGTTVNQWCCTTDT